MALDLIRENLDMERVVSEGASQALVEGSVLVPGNGHEEIRVLVADGVLTLGNTEVQSDRVALEGGIRFTALYTLGDDGHVRSLEANCPFTHALDVRGAGARMTAEVFGELESVEAESGAGRITLRGIASVKARVIEKTQAMCLSDVVFEGDTATQTLSRAVSVASTVAEGECRLPLHTEIELPESLKALEALYQRTDVRVTRVTAEDDCVRVVGELGVQTWLTCDLPDRPLTTSHHTLPFEAEVPAIGSTSLTKPWAEVQVADITAGVVLGETSACLLQLDAVLSVSASAVAARDAETLVDAYTVSDVGIKLAKERMILRSAVTAIEVDDTLKMSITLPSGTPAVRTLLALAARPLGLTISGHDGRTSVEGVIDLTALYVPQGGEKPMSYHEEAPFRAVFGAEVPAGAWVRLTASDCEAIPITADRLEFKCTLGLRARCWDTQEVELALDADEYTCPPVKGGIVLAFAQQGETLWDIAKRYRVTGEELMRLNPGITAELAAGDKLLLYRRSIEF